MEDASPTLKLEFDRGTLLLGTVGSVARQPREECPAAANLAFPGVLWDPRVHCHRAPAYRYGELVEELRRRDVKFDDLALEAPRRGQRLNAPPLRPYQNAAALSHLENGRRGIVVMPTGSGKTHVAVSVMAGVASALCLVPTRVLLHQWREHLLAAGAGIVGVVGDGEHTISPITVTTFESAYRHMATLGNRFELLVVDEAHHFGGGIRDEALEMCAAPYRLGLTATPPPTTALERLEPLLGPVVFQQSLAELRGPFLADFEIVVLRLPLSRDEQLRYDADYGVFSRAYRDFRTGFPGGEFAAFVAAAQSHPAGRRALAAFHRSRELLGLTQAKRRVVSELLARHRDSRVMVFTDANAAAYRLAIEHLIAPITCDIGQKERERVLSAFGEGSIRAIVSARVLNEGIDVPDADIAIVVGGSHGEREHVQRVGRLLRPRPGKRAVVYELVSAVEAEERRGTRRRQALLPSTPQSRGGSSRVSPNTSERSELRPPPLPAEV